MFLTDITARLRLFRIQLSGLSVGLFLGSFPLHLASGASFEDGKIEVFISTHKDMLSGKYVLEEEEGLP